MILLIINKSYYYNFTLVTHSLNAELNSASTASYAGHFFSVGSASSDTQLSNNLPSSIFNAMEYFFTSTMMASDETTADTWTLDPTLHSAKIAIFFSIFGFKRSINACKFVQILVLWREWEVKGIDTLLSGKWQNRSNMSDRRISTLCVVHVESNSHFNPNKK